jgi:diguanylate cyclase (GGDEF)-like protein
VLSNDLLLARLGGDEFALLVTGEEARKRAGSFGRHAIRALKIPFDIDGRVIMVGASIGIAVADVHDLSAEELLRRADVAMYHAKQQGPNQISYTIPPSMRFVTSASPSPTTSARPSRLTS